MLVGWWEVTKFQNQHTETRRRGGSIVHLIWDSIFWDASKSSLSWICSYNSRVRSYRSDSVTALQQNRIQATSRKITVPDFSWQKSVSVTPVTIIFFPFVNHFCKENIYDNIHDFQEKGILKSAGEKMMKILRFVNIDNLEILLQKHRFYKK